MTETNFNDISLNVVLYNKAYSRNRGTLSQIIMSLTDMSNRLTSPVNDYQKELYPFIQGECKKLVDRYNELLSTVDKADYAVFGYYLNGPKNNGKRKMTTTQHERKSYSASEYKETLRSVSDRLRHIKHNCQKKYEENKNEVYVRMSDFCDSFSKCVGDSLEHWDKMVQQFRTTNGITYSKKDRDSNSKKNRDPNMRRQNNDRSRVRVGQVGQVGQVSQGN